MTARARAAVLVGRRRIEIAEFPLPECGEDDGVLRIASKT